MTNCVHLTTRRFQCVSRSTTNLNILLKNSRRRWELSSVRLRLSGTLGTFKTKDERSRRNSVHVFELMSSTIFSRTPTCFLSRSSLFEFGTAFEPFSFHRRRTCSEPLSLHPPNWTAPTHTYRSRARIREGHSPQLIYNLIRDLCGPVKIVNARG